MPDYAAWLLARVAITALSATLFGMISLSFPASRQLSRTSCYYLASSEHFVFSETKRANLSPFSSNFDP